MKRIGIIGGGQLGMMLIKYGFTPEMRDKCTIRVIDPSKECSCAPFSDEFNQGGFYDRESLFKFAAGLDVITIEIEHISVPILEEIQQQHPNIQFIPSIETLEIIQDKRLQKMHYKNHNIPTSDFKPFRGREMYIPDAPNTSKVWKAAKGGYDGRGVEILRNISEEGIFLDEPCVLEELVDIKDEVSVVILKGRGYTSVFPPVKMVFDKTRNILDYQTNYNRDNIFKTKVVAVAENAVNKFPGYGLFAVEMFVTKDDRILVNEIAPRPHNSCHHTIHTNNFSAYRRLADLLCRDEDSIPLIYNDYIDSKFVMKNILGPGNYTGGYVLHKDIPKDVAIDTSYLVDYKKSETRPSRKIGHITLKIPEDVDTDDIDMHALSQKLEGCVKVVPINRVAVVMGSTSDWPVMKGCCEILEEFNVPYTKTVVSAHRTPERLYEFAKGAREDGVSVIVAGAGGAAHLPGMVASMTELPVIGVPVKSSGMNGLDSLYSIVQMPPGVPVATVAINGAKNAGILAAQILGYYDVVRNYKDGLRAKVEETANDLEL